MKAGVVNNMVLWKRVAVSLVLAVARAFAAFGQQEGTASSIADATLSATSIIAVAETTADFCPTRMHSAVRGQVYRNHSLPGIPNLGAPQPIHVHPANAKILPYSVCHGHRPGPKTKSCVDTIKGPVGTPPQWIRLNAGEQRKAGQMHDERPLDLGSLMKSRKSMGNVWRFRQFLCKVLSGNPTRILVVGGSNCQNAYLPTDEPAWPTVLQEYLNEQYPVKPGTAQSAHVVVNRGQGGEGTCVTAPRLHHFIGNGTNEFDLVLSEFAINDAQFAEQLLAGSAPPLGEQYSQIAECMEIFIRNLLKSSSTTALVLVELPNLMLQFSTAGQCMR